MGGAWGGLDPVGGSLGWPGPGWGELEVAWTRVGGAWGGLDPGGGSVGWPEPGWGERQQEIGCGIAVWYWYH